MINESRIILLKKNKLSKRKVMRFLDNGVLMVTLICQSLFFLTDFPVRTYGFIVFVLINIVPLARLAYKYFGLTLVSIVLMLTLALNAAYIEIMLRLNLNLLVILLVLVKTRTNGLKYYMPALSATILFHFWAYFMQEFQQSRIYVFKSGSEFITSNQVGQRYLNLSRVSLSMSVKSGAIFYSSMTLYFLSIYYESFYNRKFNFSCDHSLYRQEKVFIALCIFASFTLAVCSQSMTMFLYFIIFFVILVGKVVRHGQFKFLALIYYIKNTKNSLLFEFTTLIMIGTIAIIINTFRPSYLDSKKSSLFGILDYFNLLSQKFLTFFIEFPFGLGVGYTDIYKSVYTIISDMSFIVRIYFEFGFLPFMIFILLVEFSSRHIPYFIIFVSISAIAIGHYSDIYLISFCVIWLTNKNAFLSRPLK
jgi:hypothetical protein